MALPKKSQGEDIATLTELSSKAPIKETSSIKDFDTEMTSDEMAPFSVSALGLAFDTVVKAVDKNVIPEYELRKLLDVLPAQEESQDFGADFDMAQEITVQLAALKAIRNKIFSIDGEIRDGQSIKDAKDFMSSSTTLLQLLQKSRSELINTERLQAIEQATIETVRELDEDSTKLFLENLGERLERIR